MPILKDYQLVGPFKAGVVGKRANIGCGEISTGVSADNSLSSVNTSHLITRIGIQYDYPMPLRYMEGLKKDGDRVEENAPQDLIKDHLDNLAIRFKPKNNETVYLDNEDDKEVFYYYPKLYVEDGEVKEYPEYDIYIRGSNYMLSADSAVDNSFESYYTIPETGVLELDNMSCYSLELYFLRDMPPQTTVDIVWNYKN